MCFRKLCSLIDIEYPFDWKRATHFSIVMKLTFLEGRHDRCLLCSIFKDIAKYVTDISSGVSRNELRYCTCSWNFHFVIYRFYMLIESGMEMIRLGWLSVMEIVMSKCSSQYMKKSHWFSQSDLPVTIIASSLRDFVNQD